MSWFSKICRNQASHKKNLLVDMFIPPAILSLFTTTKSSGIAWLFRIIYSGRLLAVASTGSPTVLKPWVFMRFGSFPPFDWPAHLHICSHPASARKRILQPGGHCLCKVWPTEGPGHSVSASLHGRGLGVGGLGKPSALLLHWNCLV